MAPQLLKYFLISNENSHQGQGQGLFKTILYFQNLFYCKSYHGKTKISKTRPFFKKFLISSPCYCQQQTQLIIYSSNNIKQALAHDIVFNVFTARLVQNRSIDLISICTSHPMKQMENFASCKRSITVKVNDPIHMISYNKLHQYMLLCLVV